MREIKFRARWRDTLKVVPDFMNEYCLDALNDDCFIIEQYTGLKDSHGTEIYEGDIVRWDDASKGKYWRVAEVVWDDRGEWCYKVIPDLCVNCFKERGRDVKFGLGSYIYTPEPSRDGNVLEVISNIHENKESQRA